MFTDSCHDKTRTQTLGFFMSLFLGDSFFVAVTLTENTPLSNPPKAVQAKKCARVQNSFAFSKPLVFGASPGLAGSSCRLFAEWPHELDVVAFVGKPAVHTTYEKVCLDGLRAFVVGELCFFTLD